MTQTTQDQNQDQQTPPSDDERGADKLREYEALVETANRTRDPLDERSIQQIDRLVQEVGNLDDPIFQVNCLQLIADLACSKQALAVLEQKQVPQKLIALLEQSDPLIVPHALKFFYRVDPLDLQVKYKKVLDQLCDYCQSENVQLLDYAVDLIGALGRGGFTARQVLDNHPYFKTKCLSRLGSTIVCSNELIKSRTLRCLTDLLEFHDEDPQDEASRLSETFYLATLEGEHRMTNQLLALCRVPFMEIRINAMLVIAAIANMEWGQRELCTHPGFLKWILDRSTEACKEGKEAKFEILKTIVKSKTASRIFKGEDYMKMRADFKNGPFHVGVAEEMQLDDTPAS